MTTRDELVELVEGAAKARGDTPVPRRFIKEALQRIERNEEQVTRYLAGAPSLIEVYEIAMRLESESATQS
jgi:hypothetical protein